MDEKPEASGGLLFIGPLGQIVATVVLIWGAWYSCSLLDGSPDRTLAAGQWIAMAAGWLGLQDLIRRKREES